MRLKKGGYILIFLFALSFGLILLSAAVKGKEYALGVSEEDHLALIYEYTKVDDKELKNLAESTGVGEYEDLADIKEDNQFKMDLYKIESKENYWEITSALYSGENLDKRGEDVESKAYKNPEDLADKILEEEAKADFSLYFLPVDVEDYLEELEESILDSDEYYEVEYDLFVDGSELTFDYTPYNYSDTIVQEYNGKGILESFEILSDGEKVFKLELVDSYEEQFSLSLVFIAIIVTIVAVSTAAVSYVCWILVLKKKKPSKKEESNKYTDHIKLMRR
ncbi:MAG: hypothetical protein ACFFAN_10520 [Promethearchaeota archaeon]